MPNKLHTQPTPKLRLQSGSVIKTDRSRIEAYQKCPRSRWWQYEAQTPESALGGYQPDKPAFALEIGSGFHKGMEYTLRHLLVVGAAGALQFNGKSSDQMIDEAVAAGIAEYDSNILPYFEGVSTNLNLDPDTEDESDGDDVFVPYTVNEGRALVEALIRVYCAAPAGLASLLEEYEVLEVEQEIDVPLDYEECNNCAGMGWTDAVGTDEGIKCSICKGRGRLGSIILMSRPDGILRSRKDGQLYVLSFKSTGKWDQRKARSAAYDTEGISQLVAAEHKYNETFAGVQMVYAVKGYKMKDGDLWKVHNGVIRPYMKKSRETGGWEWEERDPGMLAFSYNYKNEHNDPERLKKAENWQKVNLWEYGADAIRLWVDYMAQGQWPTEIYGNVDMLDKMVIMPEPFYRDEASIEEWKREAVAQEMQIAAIASALNGAEEDILRRARASLMASTFPKYRHSCTYPSPCPFIPVCHEGMPIEVGFKPRTTPNHPQEKEGE